MQKFCLVFFFLLMHVKITRAETCFWDFQRDTSNAKVIFIGKVLTEYYRQVWTDAESQSTIYNFQILESFKGLRSSQSICSVIVPFRNFSIRFLKDSTYLVFGYQDAQLENTLYTTDECTLSGSLDSKRAKHALALLGFPIVHDPPNSSQFSISNMYLESSKLDSMRMQCELTQSSMGVKIQYSNNTIRNLWGLVLLLSLIIVFLALQLRRWKKLNSSSKHLIREN